MMVARRTPGAGVRKPSQKRQLASDAITHTHPPTHEMMSVGQLPLSDHSGRFAHITTDTVYNVLRSSGTSPNFFNTG
jgi:hypothetical protein